MRSKDISFIRHGTVVIGLNKISATLVSTRGRKVLAKVAQTSMNIGEFTKVKASDFFGNFVVNAANTQAIAQAA